MKYYSVGILYDLKPDVVHTEKILLTVTIKAQS